jgi:pyruvate,water dikinase
MKTSAETCNRLSEGTMPGPGREKWQVTLSKGRVVGVVMHGRTASLGIATGRAAVVMNEDDMASVKEGAVIVSKTASPALLVVMSKACAIATEHGGQGAIASGYAREYGIPAVVGVPGLIKTVKAGDLVRVDGTKGTVEIIRRNARRQRSDE